MGKEHAWTLTSGISDNNDIYLEVLNPTNPGQYLFQGEYRDFDCRSETIVVRGAPAVTQLVCESVHGPLLGSAPGIAFSLKSAVHGLEIARRDSLTAARKTFWNLGFLGEALRHEDALALTARQLLRQALEQQDAVEMIDLVVQATRKQPLGLDRHRVALEVEALGRGLASVGVVQPAAAQPAAGAPPGTDAAGAGRAVPGRRPRAASGVHIAPRT